MRALPILLPLTCAALLAACGDGGAGSAADAGSGALRESGRVARVVDGDTLVVRLGDGRRRRVRLIGIDTPETKRPDSPVECGGPEASAAMRRLALRGEGRRARGREVVLVADRSQDREDRFGRRLAYVDAGGEAGGPTQDLGLALVRAGWARARAYAGRYARQAVYEVAQTRARLGRRGVWGLCR